MDEVINNQIQREKAPPPFYTTQHPVLNPCWPLYDLVFLERRMGNPSQKCTAHSLANTHTHAYTIHIILFLSALFFISAGVIQCILFQLLQKGPVSYLHVCIQYIKLLKAFNFFPPTQCQVAFSGENGLWCTGRDVFYVSYSSPTSSFRICKWIEATKIVPPTD